MKKSTWTTAVRAALLATVALVAALALAACGDDETTTTEADEPAALSPQAAIAEVDAVRDGLDESLDAYLSGDAEKAEQLAGDAYLEHFELVEGPLEEIDEELNESLEHLIREDLREAITSGASDAEVRSLVKQANRGLDQAEKALQGANG